MTTILEDVQPSNPASPFDMATVERARQLVPLLRKNAAETERARMVVAENIQALRNADLNHLAVPKRFGGAQHNLRTFLETVAELGRGCGSTAWVTALHNGNGFLAGLFGDKCQEDIWGESPKVQFCGVFSSSPTVTSKKVKGGWQVSGSWGFASGCHHADWALISLPVVDEAGAVVDQGIALMPMSRFSIKDTWHVAGMRGTGSNTLVAHDILVPEHRTISIVKAVGGINGNEHPDEALYRSAFVPYLCLIVTAPMLGMVQGALDYVDELLAKDKAMAYVLAPSARSVASVQRSRAEAQIAFDDAWLHARRVATLVDEAAASSTYPAFAERARMKMGVGNILRLLRTSMHHLLDIGGASSFAESCPLQRFWRDLEVASRHGVLNPQIAAEAYGRVLVGVQEPITPLV